jgi:hypothetical protein
MFYIVKIYICVKKIFYMMGKKKVAQVMQPEASSSFLAGQVQPTTGQGEVSGIQEIQINEGELQNITAIEYEYCYYAPYGITKCAVYDCDRYPTYKIVDKHGRKFYVCKPHAKMILNQT